MMPARDRKKERPNNRQESKGRRGCLEVRRCQLFSSSVRCLILLPQPRTLSFRSVCRRDLFGCGNIENVLQLCRESEQAEAMIEMFELDKEDHSELSHGQIEESDMYMYGDVAYSAQAVTAQPVSTASMGCKLFLSRCWQC